MAFDLDDTGVRSSDRLKQYHQQVLGRLAVSPMPSDGDIDRLVGGPRDEVFSGLYPANRMEEAKRLFGEVASTDPHPSSPIPGVPQALGRLVRLGGVPYGWATNRTRQTEAAIRGGGIDPNEAAFIYDGNFGSKTDGLKAALRQMNMPARTFGMGGDTDMDMIAAAEADADILKVGILEYAAEPAALKRAADITFPNLPEFVEAVLKAKTRS